MTGPSGLTPGRLGMAALIALAYIGASAWLIRGEGEAYRDLLRARQLALAPKLPPPEPLRPSPVTPEPERIAPPIAAPPKAVEPAPKLVESKNPAPVPPPLPPLDPFWELPDQKKVWDLDRLTSQDERRLGAALHEMVLHTHKTLDEGPLARRVREAARPFLKALTRPDLEYTFTVLDCDESNAFSHPGGYVYLCRGIFDWIAEEEDYALAFLLGHEIAHVDVGHAVRCLRDPEIKKLGAGTVSVFASILIPYGYSRSAKQDFEADRWAWQVMNRAGRSRRECLAFLRKLEDHAGKNGFAGGWKKPGDNLELAPIDNHLRAHPSPGERLDKLRELIDPAPKPG